MSDVSVILEKIRKEKINIELEGKDNFSFKIANNKLFITIPYSIDLSESKTTHILAHEFGHYLFYKRYKRLSSFFGINRRVANKLHLIPSCLLLAEEIDAWVRGFLFCKSNQIRTRGYLLTSIKSISTYLKPIIFILFRIIKHIISLFAISFAITKTLKISSVSDVPPSAPPFIKEQMIQFWKMLDGIHLDGRFTEGLFIMLLIFYFAGCTYRLLYSSLQSLQN